MRSGHDPPSVLSFARLPWIRSAELRSTLQIRAFGLHSFTFPRPRHSRPYPQRRWQPSSSPATARPTTTPPAPLGPPAGAAQRRRAQTGGGAGGARRRGRVPRAGAEPARFALDKPRKIVGARIGLEPRLDERRLVETDCGRVDRPAPSRRFRPNLPEGFAAFLRADPDFAFPGGESFAAAGGARRRRARARSKRARCRRSSSATGWSSAPRSRCAAAEWLPNGQRVPNGAIVPLDPGGGGGAARRPRGRRRDGGELSRIFPTDSNPTKGGAKLAHPCHKIGTFIASVSHLVVQHWRRARGHRHSPRHCPTCSP